MFAYRHPSLQMAVASQLEHSGCKFREISGLFSLTFHSIRHSLGRMCGRYRHKSDKQRIAEVFQVEVGLDDLPYEEGDDLRPQSLQPVICLRSAKTRVRVRAAFPCKPSDGRTLRTGSAQRLLRGPFV